MKKLIGFLTSFIALAFIAVPVFASTASVNFDTPTFTTGDINGQNNWMKTGPYDVEVETNTYGIPSFGDQTLRISNAVTSSSFGDHTFAEPLADAVGEADATANGYPEGVRQTRFDMQFDIASTSPTEQPGMFLSVSPDRGDGSRMSYLSFTDTSTGIDVTFYDVQGTSSPANFVGTSIATLDRTVPHTVRLVMDVVDGASNDVVEVYVDGVLVHTGTSWENYYRFDTEASAEQSPRIVRTVLFRTSGTAIPANAGNGFLFDNLTMESASTPAADTEAPDVEITAPADGAVLTGTVDVHGTVTDANPWRYYTVVRDSSNAVVAGPGTVNDSNSFTDQSLFMWDTTAVPDGTYTIRLEARDQFDNKDAGSVDVITVEVNNIIGPPTDKNECKNGGWMTFNSPTFKNQGQCVSYVQSNEKAGKR